MFFVIKCVFVCVCVHPDSKLRVTGGPWFSYFSCRGAGADLPIRSNEAMASQWKQGLITLVYLHVQSGSQFPVRICMSCPQLRCTCSGHVRNGNQFHVRIHMSCPQFHARICMSCQQLHYIFAGHVRRTLFYLNQQASPNENHGQELIIQLISRAWPCC